MTRTSMILAALFAAAPLALLGCEDEAEVETGIGEYEIEQTEDEGLLENEDRFGETRYGEDEGILGSEEMTNDNGVFENENDGLLQNNQDAMEDEDLLEDENRDQNQMTD